MHAQLTHDRPWTVYALVAWALAGAVWALITDDGNLGIEILWFAVSILFAAAIWKGARWAFTLSFMLASLCAGAIVLVLLVQTFLFEGPFETKLLLPLASTVVWMALLMHPDTKRFARVDEPLITEPT